jgi:hypothetical protein
LLHRALGGRIKTANRLNRVAEKLNPQGLVRERREQIDDPATHTHLALFLDQRHSAVAPLHQVIDQIRKRQFLSRAELQGSSDQFFLRHNPLEQRLNRGD